MSDERSSSFKKTLTRTVVNTPLVHKNDSCCADGACCNSKKTEAQVLSKEEQESPLRAATIEKHLKAQPFVKSVMVNFSTGKMRIEHECSIENIIREVENVGYKASLESGRSNEAKSQTISGYSLTVLSGVFLAFGFIGSYTNIHGTVITLLYALSMVIAGYKPVKSAYYALKSGSLDMNVLMSAAALGAACIGQWLEGATVVWLFAIGNALQNKSIEKTRNSIRSLMDLASPEAWVKSGRELIRRPVEEVSIGDIIVVKPGDKIPLDGEVVLGASSVNQSPITGEYVPVDKRPAALKVYFSSTPKPCLQPF
jgi:Cd2+/Zn2+-exporting ATPase